MSNGNKLVKDEQMGGGLKRKENVQIESCITFSQFLFLLISFLAPLLASEVVVWKPFGCMFHAYESTHACDHTHVHASSLQT